MAQSYDRRWFTSLNIKSVKPKHIKHIKLGLEISSSQLSIPRFLPLPSEILTRLPLSKFFPGLLLVLLDFPFKVVAVIVAGAVLQVPLFWRFLFISYQQPATGLYGKGPADVMFLFFWINLFTMLRAAFMQYVLMPLGEWGQIKSQRKLTRFTEQGWTVVYYSLSWGVGMVSVGCLWIMWEKMRFGNTLLTDHLTRLLSDFVIELDVILGCCPRYLMSQQCWSSTAHHGFKIGSPS